MVWEAIYHIFPDIRSFSPDDINDPRNALTMYAGLHSEFGKLELCFEPTVSLPPSHLFTANKGMYRLSRIVTVSKHIANFPLFTLPICLVMALSLSRPMMVVTHFLTRNSFLSTRQSAQFSMRPEWPNISNVFSEIVMSCAA
jgi:HNH endonuclease